jgi:hypothetical protein
LLIIAEDLNGPSVSRGNKGEIGDPGRSGEPGVKGDHGNPVIYYKVHYYENSIKFWLKL